MLVIEKIEDLGLNMVKDSMVIMEGVDDMDRGIMEKFVNIMVITGIAVHRDLIMVKDLNMVILNGSMIVMKGKNGRKIGGWRDRWKRNITSDKMKI
jgi:hypothetical protein